MSTRFAFIQAGVVTELVPAVLVVDGQPVTLAQRYAPDFVAALVPVPDNKPVEPGWQLLDGRFIAPSAPTAAPMPIVVSMRQARLALLASGRLAAVSQAINSLPSPQREAAHIEWEYAQEVRRDSSFLQQLAGALGLGEQDLDTLFALASTL